MSEVKKGPTNLLVCGSCTFIEREKIFEKKCSELGKLPSARACPSHKSDAFSLVQTDQGLEGLDLLSGAIASFSPMELNALASLMLKEKQTRKFGFHFYQKVFVRIQGQVRSNYFNNFVIGHVLDATKETVRIVGVNGRNTVCVYAINEPDSTTFYTIDRFAPIRENMIANKAFVDPEFSGGEHAYSLKGHFRSLGSAEANEILETSSLAKRRLKRAPKDDLVSLVARVSRGHISRRKSSSSQDDTKEIRII